MPGLAIALFSAVLSKSRHPAGMPLILLGAALSLTAYLHSYALQWMGNTIAMATIATIIPFPFFAWQVTAWIFDDSFRLGRRELGALAAIWVSQLVCFGLLKRFYPGPATLGGLLVLGIAIGIPFVTTAALMGLSVRLVLRDARTDLVESRRALRMKVLTAVAVVVLVSASLEVLQLALGVFDREGATLIVAILANAIIGTFAIGFLSVDGSLFTSPPVPCDVRASAPEQAPEDELRLVIAKIEQLMKEGLYLDSELTIGKLAQKAGFPEYKVRRAINGVLGHRNFNQYLNKYRTHAASERLALADDARTKVMTIALEVGYKSLASFNKAFREIYGMTPTDYRRTAKKD